MTKQKHVAKILVALMVVAARVVKLESVALLVARMDAAMIQIAAAYNYSTVTDFARFLGLSTLVFFFKAT